MSDASPTLRLDKWLWYARFFKTRSLSAKLVTGGHVRVNANKVAKASHAVGPGDTLTFPQGKDIRVVRVVAVGSRRGPAPEAQALYEDLTPPKPAQVPDNSEALRKGRPSRQERRAVIAFKEGLE